MSTIASRDLRNRTADVLRQVTGVEQITLATDAAGRQAQRYVVEIRRTWWTRPTAACSRSPQAGTSVAPTWSRGQPTTHQR